MRRQLALVVCVLAVSATSPVHAAAILAGFDSNTLARNDDGSTGAVGIGFGVNFFGTTYTQLFVNNNGNVTFDAPLGTFTPFPLLTTAQVIIAPFFADVDTRSAGNPVTYGGGTAGGRSAFGVNWVDVDYYASSTSHTNRNSFQLIVVERFDTGAGNFDFWFNYDQIQWETGQASGGNSSGLGGNSARVGWSNGSTASFELAGSAIDGALLDGGPNALISGRLNSSVDGRYIFEVRNGDVIGPAVPEPGTLLLLGSGISALVLRRRRKS